MTKTTRSVVSQPAGASRPFEEDITLLKGLPQSTLFKDLDALTNTETGPSSATSQKRTMSQLFAVKQDMLEIRINISNLLSWKISSSFYALMCCSIIVFKIFSQEKEAMACLVSE